MKWPFRNNVDGERGAALLVVLWASVLIAGLATVVAGTVRTDLSVARHQLAEAQARHHAQAGLMHGALLLLAGEDPVLMGRATVRYAGHDVDLRFADECGKVDLNTGWGTMVRRLVAQHSQGGGGAAAILDWRDPDTATTPGGAEVTQYRAAGRTHGVRNGPFDSIAELPQLLGVGPTLAAALRPLVTVDCLNAGIDPVAAPTGVLAALPGLSAEARQTYLRDREAYVSGGVRGAPPALPVNGRYLDASPGLAVEISARVSIQGGGLVSWRAVTWLTGDAGLPLLFRTWERGDP